MRSTLRNASSVAGPEMPSTVKPGVALELAQRARGLGTEDAVLAPGVEAEPVEGVLQRGDVVAAEVRRLQVQQPVAEHEATLDQRGPGLGPDDAVDADLARRLEGADRGLGRRAEGAELRRRDGLARADEPVLEVADRVAAVTRAQDRRGAHAATRS